MSKKDASERGAPAHRNPVPEISPEEIVKYTWLQAFASQLNNESWIEQKDVKKKQQKQRKLKANEL